MRCGSSGPASGEFLLTAGTALAIEMSRRLSVEEMELLAAFLTVLADQLALLALRASPCEGGAEP